MLRAGAGDDLAQARAPLIVGTSPRRIAVIAVAVSASAESRATPSRGEILGRPGVNALRYAPDVTVDSSTFATLENSPLITPGAPKDETTLVVAGREIRKGARTVVDIVADNQDVQDILARIKEARATADIVLLLVHSHEPGNQSESPAVFLRKFAREAIDCGASLVIGQGPHRLRGIEAYKTGVILYSLGNFMFSGTVDLRAEDAYDSGVDLYQLALGAVSEAGRPPQPVLDDPATRESVIALASFARGVLNSVRLQPIDLGPDAAASERGIPRIADAERGRQILARLSNLSHDFGTELKIQNSSAVVYPAIATQTQP
jgi:poly-gamma-glutamate synthesis protein (capsule biosynthesis protein)